MVGLYAVGVLIGAFMVCVGLFNWDFWFYDPESRLIEAIGGENAVRLYWIVAGLGLIAWSILAWVKGW